ncbi:MAG: prephenate dehydratase, partial [Acidobacteriota bacterium]|nr:prephenate dehydratase [Acidobacteriota bacterium]
LIVPPGVRFGDLRRVYSHPVALNQCLDFFADNPSIEKVPFYDTAGSVKMVMEQKPADAGAIASAVAASIYGGRILRKSIEDDRQNFTRFFLLNGARRLTPLSPGKTWKTSLVFTVRNAPGQLFRSVSAFGLRDLNLTKIESRPLRGKPWEYLFYLDFIGREDDPRVKNALSHLAEMADFLRVLGSYPL